MYWQAENNISVDEKFKYSMYTKLLVTIPFLFSQLDTSSLSGSSASKSSTKSSSSLLSASVENVADVPFVSAQLRSAVSLDQLPSGQSYLAKPTSLPDLSDGRGTKK